MSDIVGLLIAAGASLVMVFIIAVIILEVTWLVDRWREKR